MTLGMKDEMTSSLISLFTGVAMSISSLSELHLDKELLLSPLDTSVLCSSATHTENACKAESFAWKFTS